MADPLQQLVEEIVGQLADVLAMTSGQPVRALPAVGSGVVDWQVLLHVAGRLEAEMTLGVAASAAQRITTIVLGAEGPYGNADVADTLREIVGQATAAHVNRTAPGLTITVGVPTSTPATPPAGAWQHDLVMDGTDPPRLVIWTSPSSSLAAETALPAPGMLTGSAATAARSATTADGTHRNLDVVLDLELPITVRFGETRLTLDQLSRLGAGSLIDLERAPDDPVDLLVNGRLVARGEVVVVSGCYGVRVREVVSAADRLRSLEG